MKVTPKVRKHLCPICLDELVRVSYSGGLFFVKDRNSPDFKRFFYPSFKEDGLPVWSVKVKRGAVARKKMAVDDGSYDKQYQ